MSTASIQPPAPSEIINGHATSAAPPTGDKPSISKRQFAYAVSASGGMAAQEAQAAGIDPLAVEALLSQPVQIGHIVFAPVSMQTLLALQLLMKRRATLRATAAPLSSGGLDGNNASTAEADEDDTDLFALAEAVLVFAQPLMAARFLQRTTEDSIRKWDDAVLQFSGELLPSQLRAMGEHINRSMALLNQLGGTSGDQVASHPPVGQVSQASTCP